VWPDAEIWSQLNTYLFPMAFLALFGLQLSHGLTCHWWILQIWQIIFFSLHFLLDSGGLRARRFFYSLFGSYVSGLFGTNQRLFKNSEQLLS
jgi:hypothetical protein